MFSHKQLDLRQGSCKCYQHGTIQQYEFSDNCRTSYPFDRYGDLSNALAVNRSSPMLEAASGVTHEFRYGSEA
jgi:hypothetical protein